ncbi:MAG: DEAD/DEAH box helicase, partial [Proteobacteria bacterium]|nr:DEAD/DEAH box helicase [Pseudomonadota bacterium]
PSNLQAIVEHLWYRQGIRSIFLEDVKKLYVGERELKSEADIAPERNLGLWPDGRIEPMADFVSGEIYPKIDQLTDAMATVSDPILKNKYQEELNEIIKHRKSTALEDVSFTMNQRWIPKKYVLEFLKTTELKKAEITYGEWQKDEYEDRITGQMKTRKLFAENTEAVFGEYVNGSMKSDGFVKQFINYLNGKKVAGQQKKDGSGEVVQDNKKEYNDKVRAYEEQFQAFMEQHPSGMEIQELYNRKFNSYTPFEFSEEPLDLTGYSSGKIKLHGYQAAAVRRLSEEGRGILAFDVGLGKSFSALGLYGENLKMGRSKRTCIVVPNAVLANWYHESRLFLGDLSKTLFVGFEPKTGKDGKVEQEEKLDEKGSPTGEFQDMITSDSADEKRQKAHSIPQSNYSLVVMTKDFFKTSPLKPETTSRFIAKQVDRKKMSQDKADGILKGNLVDDDGKKSKKGKKGRSHSDASQQERTENR